MGPNRDDLILVDGHVHLRSCFDIASFLRAAHANFNDIAQEFSSDRQLVGVLFLADAPREHGFKRLEDALDGQHVAREGKPRAWCLHDTWEDSSLYLTLGRDSNLIVISGRQIVSQEDLEALAIGTCEHFDRKPIADLIQDIADTGALPIIPWGAGKWIGARGRLVKRLIRNPNLPRFFLGDSGNRPIPWSQPSHFRLAESKGIKNLPGTDPLPTASECQRAGSFGFALRGALDMKRPTQDLKRKLLDPSTTIEPFGRGETLLRFLRNQSIMQYRKLVEP